MVSRGQHPPNKPMNPPPLRRSLASLGAGYRQAVRPLTLHREQRPMRLRYFAWTIAIFLVSCTQQTPTPQSASTKELDQSVPSQDSRQSVRKYEATASKGWVWVKAGNNVSTYWDVETGPADVTIDDKKFSAKLYWKENPTELKTSLEGTIQEGKLTAKEVIQASDNTGSVYTGTYMKTEYVQTINLSDGLGMIGITQPIKQ